MGRKAEITQNLGLSGEFVIHSLRNTMLTRLGEAGADAFAIMKIAGHSSVTVSQRYVHPRQILERAFERLDALNAAKRTPRRQVLKSFWQCHRKDEVSSCTIRTWALSSAVRAADS